MKSQPVLRMTASAMFIAIGIIIPLFSPAKIFIPPAASYTLASHVPIFLAMMISPWMGVAVAIGTTIGFFFSTPVIVALRAASHLVFVLIGGFYIQKRPKLLESPVKVRVYSFLIAILHAVCEVAVVSLFFFGGSMGELIYEQGFFYYVILLVGIGSAVHSMADFEIALFLNRVLSRQRGFAALKARKD